MSRRYPAPHLLPSWLLGGADHAFQTSNPVTWVNEEQKWHEDGPATLERYAARARDGLCSRPEASAHAEPPGSWGTFPLGDEASDHWAGFIGLEKE